nr:MAG TPA: hypothetical protein [Bacteriophage sp.]
MFWYCSCSFHVKLYLDTKIQNIFNHCNKLLGNLITSKNIC